MAQETPTHQVSAVLQHPNPPLNQVQPQIIARIPAISGLAYLVCAIEPSRDHRQPSNNGKADNSISRLF